MPSPTLNQIRKVISEENQKLRSEFKSELSDVKSGLLGVKSEFTKLNRKVDKNHREVKVLFNDLDRKVFHVDQRLSRIEYHLGQPTPKFDPTAHIESVFINPIQK